MSRFPYRDKKGKSYVLTYLKILQSELNSVFNHAVWFCELKSTGSLGKGKAEEMQEYMHMLYDIDNKAA